MRGFGTTPRARAPVPADAPCDRDADIYDCHAPALYRQALLTLGDAGMAEQVVCDVIVEECVRPSISSGDGHDAGYRLAVSAYRRCQELPGGLARRNRAPGQRLPGSFASRIDPGGLLSGKERGALGLVLFGGLGYGQASRELAIAPADIAALLRAVLHRLTTSAAPPLAEAAGLCGSVHDRELRSEGGTP